MDFQDVVFLPSRASFSTTSKKLVVEVKVSRPPHVLRLWLGVSKGTICVKYIRYDKASFLSPEYGYTPSKRK